MSRESRFIIPLLAAILATGPAFSTETDPAPIRNIGGPGDYAIREKLLRKLAAEPALRGQPIEVILANGGVVFSGEVDNCSLRQRILRTASSLLGVINVTDMMRVRAVEIEDEALEKAVRGLLAGRHEEFGLEDFEVRVEDSVATLSGTVRDLSARVQLEDGVGTIFGITEIDNQLRPAGAPSGADDASLLKAVLDYLRNFRVYGFPGEVEVRVEDGVVHLSGRVRLHVATSVAVTVASLVGGVRHVESDLEVDPSITPGRPIIEAAR